MKIKVLFKTITPTTIKIGIILAYIQRYEFGHEKDFAPPITAIHLAALTPAKTKEGTKDTKRSVVNV